MATTHSSWGLKYTQVSMISTDGGDGRRGSGGGVPAGRARTQQGAGGFEPLHYGTDLEEVLKWFWPAEQLAPGPTLPWRR
jgi:hypothetical protein